MPIFLKRLKVSCYLLSFIGIIVLAISNNGTVGVITVISVSIAAGLSIAAIPLAIRDKRAHKSKG
jgi:hypothetical protein